MKPSTAALLEVLIRLAKGAISALERWFNEQKADQAK